MSAEPDEDQPDVPLGQYVVDKINAAMRQRGHREKATAVSALDEGLVVEFRLGTPADGDPDEPRHPPTPGNLLVLVADDFIYHRIADGREPPTIDVSDAAKGIPPVGWTKLASR